MRSRPHVNHQDSEDHLQAVARILAEALLRHRLRQFMRNNQGPITKKISLEVVPNSSTHAVKQSQNGEDK